MDCQHDWEDVYYGVRCKKCEMLCPDGQGPWMPEEEADTENEEDTIPDCPFCGGEFWDGGTSCTCQVFFYDEEFERVGLDIVPLAKKYQPKSNSEIRLEIDKAT